MKLLYRLALHLHHLARRYLPTSGQLDALWANWLGWAVAVGIAVGAGVAVVMACWRWGP